LEPSPPLAYAVPLAKKTKSLLADALGLGNAYACEPRAAAVLDVVGAVLE
jgi:hypothetical protein